MITHEVNPRYVASAQRYQTMPYQRCGKSGLRLPRLSLGLWQNFGAVDSLANARAMVQGAFNLGITHFDLANNYGPNYGSAESTFGQLMAEGLDHYRDEMIISSKAGYDMWPGPYGMGGSRKYLVASCDQSLKRCGVEYFDIFYSHCFDPETPLEETMQALDYIVRSGRALYAGISSYSAEQTRQAAAILQDLGTPLLIHQPRYNLMDRWIEDGLTDVLDNEGVGAIVFSPLNQGILTNKYLGGIPNNSRAGRGDQIYLKESDLSEEVIGKVNALNDIAQSRDQSLAQMAIAWTLNNPTVTSAIIGASRVEQINDSVAALNNMNFSADELAAIDAIVKP
ncbi:aldo/keto reductase [Gilvimarinus sp. 1_MG-2023]|uniref:aldo/keto reductase n=1 Tax=Gilvimarinus sp. 1_MG-2023 TaxID=3062638 RepID=UPI0026E48E95|nr:aldo/keto reductase [Gilvimarinus sp. 1_MG-2023]MDO6745663.1 aldo/keto reductase [Gilvimarinus sp. 1_MG-2023]